MIGKRIAACNPEQRPFWQLVVWARENHRMVTGLLDVFHTAVGDVELWPGEAGIMKAE